MEIQTQNTRNSVLKSVSIGDTASVNRFICIYYIIYFFPLLWHNDRHQRALLTGLTGCSVSSLFTARPEGYMILLVTNNVSIHKAISVLLL